MTLIRFLRHLPITAALLAAMIAARLATGPLAGPLPPPVLARRGISLDTVPDGQVERFLTATFLSRDSTMFVRQLGFAAAISGLHEWRRGGIRTGLTFGCVDVAATGLVLLGVLWPLNRLPGRAALSGTLDVGMSAGGFGRLGSLIVSTGRPAPLLGVIGLIGAGKMLFAPDPIADPAHLAALAVGAGLGRADSGRLADL